MKTALFFVEHCVVLRRSYGIVHEHYSGLLFALIRTQVLIVTHDRSKKLVVGVSEEGSRQREKDRFFSRVQLQKNRQTDPHVDHTR